MRALIGLTVCLLIAGCYTERRAMRQMERAKQSFPALFSEETKTDTVWDVYYVPVVSEEKELDVTQTRPYADRDSFSVTDQTGKVTTDVEYVRDTILRDSVVWRVRTKVERDTVEKEVKVPEVTTVTIRKVVTTERKVIPFWMWVALGVCLILALFATFKKVEVVNK